MLGNLHFANGISVSPDQSYVVVVEGSRYCLQRFWLQGPRAGETDPSGGFAETSGATEHEGLLYIGSLSGKAVGRLHVPSF